MARCGAGAGPRIRVNSLGRGRFDTDRVRTLDKGRAEAQGITVEQVAQMSKTIPLAAMANRRNRPDRRLLLSPAASYLSGFRCKRWRHGDSGTVERRGTGLGPWVLGLGSEMCTAELATWPARQETREIRRLLKTQDSRLRLVSRMVNR